MSASAPAAPGLGASTASMIRLSVLRTLRGRKLRVAGVAALVVLVFPAVVALFQDDADTVAIVKGGIDWGFFRLLVFLLPLLFCSGAVGEEVEARTMHFLAMRPLPRASIALGKYVVGTLASLAILWAALILLHLIGYAVTPTEMIEQIPATARAGGAASFLLVTYCAIAIFWGTLVPEAGGLLTVIWLGFVEWFMGLLPGVLRFVSMSHWARELGGIERMGWHRVELMGEVRAEVPDVALHWAALILACEWLVWLALALLMMHYAQLRFGKS